MDSDLINSKSNGVSANHAVGSASESHIGLRVYSAEGDVGHCGNAGGMRDVASVGEDIGDACLEDVGTLRTWEVELVGDAYLIELPATDV